MGARCGLRRSVAFLFSQVASLSQQRRWTTHCGSEDPRRARRAKALGALAKESGEMGDRKLERGVDVLEGRCVGRRLIHWGDVKSPGRESGLEERKKGDEARSDPER